MKIPKPPKTEIYLSEVKYKPDERHCVLSFSSYNDSVRVDKYGKLWLVIDTSASTRTKLPPPKETPNDEPLSILETCKNTIKEFLIQFKENNLNIVIMEFNSKIRIHYDGILNEHTCNDCINAVDKFRSGGGTDIFSAIKYVTEECASKNSDVKDNMLLFTDGEATRGFEDPNELVDAFLGNIKNTSIIVNDYRANDLFGGRKYEFKQTSKLSSTEKLNLHWIDLNIDDDGTERTKREAYARIFCNEIFTSSGENYHKLTDGDEILETFYDVFRKCDIPMFKDVELTIKLINENCIFRRDHGVNQDIGVVNGNEITYYFKYMNYNKEYEFIPIIKGDVDGFIYIDTVFKYTMPNNEIKIEKQNSYIPEFLDTNTKAYKTINTCILFGKINTLLIAQLNDFNEFTIESKASIIAGLREITSESVNDDYNKTLYKTFSNIENTDHIYKSFSKLIELKNYMENNTDVKIDDKTLSYNIEMCDRIDTIKNKKISNKERIARIESALTPEDHKTHDEILDYIELNCSFCDAYIKIVNHGLYHECKGKSKKLNNLINKPIYYTHNIIYIFIKSIHNNKTIKMKYINFIKLITSYKIHDLDFIRNIFKNNVIISKKRLIFDANTNTKYNLLEIFD